MDNLFVWQKLGYETRENWIAAGKPTTPLVSDHQWSPLIEPQIVKTAAEKEAALTKRSFKTATAPNIILRDEPIVPQPRYPVREDMDEQTAWAYVNKNGYKGETVKDKSSNALRVRNQKGGWICTIDIKNAIIYWNPTVKREKLSGFQNRFPKNRY